jgi:Fe-S-cluster containining protein
MRDALLAIYDELAAEIAAAAPVCNLSGRCCRFKEYGHTLFLSRPEAELLLEQPFPEDARLDEAGCPFQVNGLCTARERRPLGCRVYFCDPNYAGKGEALSERYIARLKQLHEAAGTPWDYRPLHEFLHDRPRATEPELPAKVSPGDGFRHAAEANLPISM